MTLKTTATARAALAIALGATATAAQAQSAGSFVLSTGWMHIAPQVSTGPMNTQLDTVFGPMSSSNSAISAKIGTANTIGLTGTYFITDHIAAEVVAGLPPKFSIYGAGSAESYGKIGSARMWSPSVLMKYYFAGPNATFRPYLGVGASYLWFSGAQITNSSFQSEVLKGDTKVSVTKGLAPVLNAGFSYAFAKNWYASLSVSFIPVSRTLTLDTPQSSARGVKSSRSTVRTQLNPIVTYLSVGYRF